MAASLSCLDNIIGLSETTCECLINGTEPADYNESESGLYLDRLDGFNINVASGADNCSEGGIWDRMVKAVSDAKIEFRTALLGLINNRFQPRAKAFIGQLGSSGWKLNLTLSQLYVGVKITPLQLVGGVIVLKRIGVLINASQNVTVKVYSNENDATLINSYTTTAPVTAGSLSWLTLGTPLELPMSSNERVISYWVVLEVNGFQVKNNKKDCGCGGVKREWKEWITFQGALGNDLTDMSTFTSNDYMNGLVLDVEIKCEASTLICGPDKLLDFANDSFSQYMAEAIRFKAGEKMYRGLLSTDQLNRLTMMNREEIMSTANQWGKNYMEVMNYLSEIIDTKENDCMKCRRNNNMVRGSILT